MMPQGFSQGQQCLHEILESDYKVRCCPFPPEIIVLKLLGIPLFAVVVGLLIVACFRLTHARLALVTGALWILYGVYEFLMQIRVLCSGECNIRVDLLLIYPILLIYTIATMIRIGRVLWQRYREGRGARG
jgi:hypothetical protein